MHIRNRKFIYVFSVPESLQAVTLEQYITI
jgi:hypothetical protein